MIKHIKMSRKNLTNKKSN